MCVCVGVLLAFVRHVAFSFNIVIDCFIFSLCCVIDHFMELAPQAINYYYYYVESNKPFSQRIVFKVQSLKCSIRSHHIRSHHMGIQELHFAIGDSECADAGENAL